MSEQAVAAVRADLARTGASLTPERVGEALRREGRPIGDAEVLAVHDALRRDVVGAGPLEELLGLEGVTDVLVNGAGQVWIDRGRGVELTDVRFADESAVRRLAQRLAGLGGRRLDDASPHVDVRLPGGTRLHAVLAPIARPGTLISLRVPARRRLDLAALVARGTVTEEAAALLGRLVRARRAFLVSGGTGSGKTTVLGALLGLVDVTERIVIVEDATELEPMHPHVVALESRPPNLEGAGQITMRTLVRQALRMRPDRLVVGEVRGAEVVDLLAALNTGHEGGCGTVHANSAGDVPARIESLAAMAGVPGAAAQSQLASALDAVLHLVRGPDGVRRLAEIGVVRRTDRGGVVVESALAFEEDRRVVRGPGCDQLSRLLTR